MNYSTTKVTMELRDVLAMTDDFGHPFELFDYDYPSYYEGEEKTAFEQKIIDHYYFHQIGVETPGRFKHNLRTKLREIMPYYIQMYKSVEIMDAVEDPFGNLDVTETYEETVSGTASSDSEGSGTHSANRTDAATRKRSDTPQGSITNIDQYLTEAETNDGTSNETGNTSNSSSMSSESSSTVKHTLTRKGNQGVNTYAHDMIEFRQSFINVDMMIIGELRDLFLLIY